MKSKLNAQLRNFWAGNDEKCKQNGNREMREEEGTSNEIGIKRAQKNVAKDES